jgi:hypothetical protein
VFEEKQAEKLQRDPIPVIVTSLPEKSPKPLFRDSSRLLSVAAFIFSLVTGTFALVHTWTDSRESYVDGVGKLIDQYYAGAEKMATLNLQTQSDYRNLLAVKQRSIALRAVELATRVEKLLDDGIWTALAQINDSEHNYSAAEIAWSSAVDRTKDIALYLFAIRGLATNLSYQGKTDSVNKTLEASLKEIGLEGKDYRFSARLTPAQQDIESAGVHATQLFLNKNNDCAYVVSHFDEAINLQVSAYQKSQTEYLQYENFVIAIRQYLSTYKKRREECLPSFERVRLLDDCLALAEILDAAPSGFAVLRGGASQNSNEVFSRVAMPGAEACFVTSVYQFYCRWPEHQEVDTKQRVEQISRRIGSCDSLGKATVLKSQDNRSQINSEFTTITVGNRQPLKIHRASSKDNFNTYWQVQVEIEPRNP